MNAATIRLGLANVDWSSVDSVIAYAKELGSGMTVYKHPLRNNFNIAHTVNEQRLMIDANWVVFRS